MKNSDLATDNFTIIDDDTCEPDEIMRAYFEEQDINLNISYPEVTYIIIEDDDSKYENLISVFNLIIMTFIRHSLGE